MQSDTFPCDRLWAVLKEFVVSNYFDAHVDVLRICA